MKPFTEDTLVIASHNKGKIKEISELLKPFNVEVVPGNPKLKEPEEDGETFEENALIKARFFAKKMKMPALADDSGLAVNALDGAPGIYSARWGGPEKDFDLAMQKVENTIKEMDMIPDGQQAHFVCALALCWPNGEEATFTGKVSGRLTFPKRGEKGFGYDPIFTPDGHQQTFAEMDPKAKHKISHRAHAFEQLVQECFAVAA